MLAWHALYLLSMHLLSSWVFMIYSEVSGTSQLVVSGTQQMKLVVGTSASSSLSDGLLLAWEARA